MNTGDVEWFICHLRREVVTLCELLSHLEQSGPLQAGDETACRDRLRQVVKSLNQLERNFATVASN